MKGEPGPTGSAASRQEALPLDWDKLARGEVSDATLRGLIRYGLARDLRARRGDAEGELRRHMELVAQLQRGPLAPATAEANAQHYEVPTDFFRQVLGRRLKYSCGYWPLGVQELDASEEAMLELVCERAQVEQGQELLDLGCGWGALSLYLAERFPGCRILGLCSSRTQKAFIDEQARARGLGNLEIATGDMATWDTSRRFDRVLSIEMFEHLGNYEAVLARIASWMKPSARLFIHIFTHRTHAYLFEGNWIAESFFTGGLMPSDSLLLYFQKDVRVLGHWRVGGQHYQRTSEAWLERLDHNRAQALEVLSRDKGPQEALRALARWRLFFLTCAESFGHAGGSEWMVSHYLFERQR